MLPTQCSLHHRWRWWWAHIIWLLRSLQQLTPVQSTYFLSSSKNNFAVSFSSLVLSSGRTFTFFFFFNAWAWPLSWELAQLDPLFSFSLLANFPDNWSRIQTEREKERFEADAKAWQSVSALCDGCGHPLSNTPDIPSFFPPSRLSRTGFIICDEVPVVWEESALNVYYIRSACTNGETPTDHVITTRQQPTVSSITSSSFCPFSSFLFCNMGKKTHTHKLTQEPFFSFTYFLYLLWWTFNHIFNLLLWYARFNSLLISLDCAYMFMWNENAPLCSLCIRYVKLCSNTDFTLTCSVQVSDKE